MTQILSGVVGLARSPTSVRLDWMPLAWAWFLFAQHVQIWFGIFEIDRDFGISMPMYVAILAAAVLLFLGGGLILPSHGRGLPEALIDDFDRFGRRALVPFAGFYPVAIAVNQATGTGLLELANVFDFALFVLALLVFFVPRRKLQRVATVAFAALQIYGFVFLWSQPSA